MGGRNREGKAAGWAEPGAFEEYQEAREAGARLEGRVLGGEAAQEVRKGSDLGGPDSECD